MCGQSQCAQLRANGREALLPVFLNVLEVYGYSAVEMDNGIIKIEKSSDAKKSNVPLITEDNQASGDMMVTRVVRVKNVNIPSLAL